MKFWYWFGLFVLFLFAAVGVWGWGKVTTLGVTRITDDVHMISGLGGNVTVLKTGSGAVVVDSMTFKIQGDKIREKAVELAGEPVRVVINTHYHLDHTHGNPAFDSETRIIASEKTAEYLRRCDKAYWEGDQGFPTELVDQPTEYTLGNKTIKLLLPGPGHTGGDLVVQFVEDEVLVMGDLFFNRYYPNIDLEAGGTVRGWPGTIDRILSKPTNFIVPGHGNLGDAKDLTAFRDFMQELSDQAGAVAQEGEDDALKSVKLVKDKDFGVLGVPLIFRLDRDFVVRRAWQEASGNVTSGGCPAS